MLPPQMLHQLIFARIPLALTLATTRHRTEMEGAVLAMTVSGVEVAGEVCGAGECKVADGV